MSGGRKKQLNIMMKGNKMSKYILDMTEADDVPEYFGDFKVIPCEKGRHVHEFDVDMDKVPARVIVAIEKFQNNVGADPKLPIGFNVSVLPVGAKLIRIS